MKYSGALIKAQTFFFVRLNALALVALMGTTTLWASQMVVPGRSSERFSEAWLEGELLVLKTEDGHLYSVPAGLVEIEHIRADEAVRTHTTPNVSDVIALLLSGVSETTIKVYIESSGERFEISTEDILSLKRAGASEGFIQYLILRGREDRTSNYIVWRGPSAPRRSAPPASELRQTGAQEYQSGIPYFPYVFPGFGAYYPIFPGRPIYPGHPSHPTQPGHTGRDNRNDDLPSGARPGYYWPETRSLMKPSETQPDRPVRPRSEPHHLGTSGTSGLWLRWKGGSNRNRGTSASHVGESYSSPAMLGAPSSNQAPGVPAMSTGSSGRAPGGRSIMGSGSATGSSGGTRSLVKKK